MKLAAKKIIKQLCCSFTEVFAPSVCEVCGDYIPEKSSDYNFICNKCLYSFPIIVDDNFINNQLISNFPNDELFLFKSVSLMSSTDDSNYMNLIYGLKYHGRRKIGFALGKELGKYLIYKNMSYYDAIIPLPIHLARTRERGYNQSEIISNGLSSVINIPVRNDILKRSIYTATQTEKNIHERKINVDSIFKPYNEFVNIKNKVLLLIDDVMTTGATLNSAAKELLILGAKRVDSATLIHA